MRFTIFPNIIVVASLALVTILAQAQSTGVMAKVNGFEIPQSLLEIKVKESVAQGKPDSPEMRKALREDLIAEEIITQEAIRMSLDLNPEVIAKLTLAHKAVLVREFQEDYIKNNAVSDDILRKEYEDVKVQMGDKEYKARHILVESESEARDIIASLKKGANFAKIAEEKSIDDGSKENGGELNWSPPAAYVRPFAEALVKLSKGELTEQPVQTSFGWHVIQLMDIRPMEVPAFEEVKQNMQQRVLQREFETVVQDLRNKAKVE